MAQAPLNSLATGEPERSTVVEQPSALGPYPLTFAQESLWFIEQLAPGTATYNLPEAWMLKGSVNGAVVQRALDEIVFRHEVLRTVFRTADGKPAQFVLPSARIELAITDLSSRYQPATELRQSLQVEAEKPFDLRQAPLARASLFHLGAEEHVLLLNLHHIISDAWSQALLIRELAEIYSALVTYRQSRLPELPIQYADFALWQRELFASEAGLRHRAYWLEFLGNLPAPVLLPADYPRPALRSFRGATQFHRLPGALTEALKELSRREGVTLFMTLLAAFKTLLHRYTGNERIVVGSPMACRERLEVEALLGFFVHTQVLQSDLSGDPPFREFLGRIRESVLQASAHQEVPCQLAWQSLPGQRSSAGDALFQVVFGFQSASPHNWTAEGIRAEKIELDTRTAKFDWTVLAAESPVGLELRSEFNTDLFEASSMSLLMKRFQVLLESIVASPQTTLSRLPLQSEAERDQLLVAWNRTESLYERDLDIHRIFEARVADAPEAVALIFEGKALSYAELNRRANQLARRMQTLGVAPGARVGLCFERSCELIIGMLSIVKAGAAYVPLEPHQPRQRLEFMLRDSGASVVLTHSACASSLPSPGTIVVCLDKIQSDLATENAENLSSRSRPAQAAYVMYTSGSTGAPKGTLIPHRAVARLVRNTNYLDFSADNVFLQLAPVSFDASTFEIWGALLNGARLVIFPAPIPSLQQLARTIQDSGVTVLWLTAGLFHQMVDHQIEELRGLKYLLAGGDILSPAHVAKAVSRLKSCQVINGYGPTENTTFTCCYRIPNPWPPDRAVPIGRPIANTGVYVLDKNMEPVPVGVAGELYAGGDGLALEYLNQPSLSAARFVRNPFNREESARLYRTGDIVRWRPDGDLEFLGRSDEQVKIRGHRVEPGEVENVLAGHPSIESAVVVVGEDSFVGKHLLAYVVSRAGCEAGEDEWRRFLETRLPSYLVPAHFVMLPSLPLTINGKIDRRALPPPRRSPPEIKTSERAPRTATESLVANIWRDLLSRDPVGVHDNFFQLGGHSLLAMQVLSRVAKECKVELPVAVIFEAPTVAKLAVAIERAQGQQPAFTVPRLAPSASTRAADLLARLDEFSEAELEELLRDPELQGSL